MAEIIIPENPNNYIWLGPYHQCAKLKLAAYLCRIIRQEVNGNIQWNIWLDADGPGGEHGSFGIYLHGVVGCPCCRKDLEAEYQKELAKQSDSPNPVCNPFPDGGC